MLSVLFFLMFSVAVVSDAKKISGRGRLAKILAAVSLIIAGCGGFYLVAGLVGALCLMVSPLDEFPFVCTLIGAVPGFVAMWIVYRLGIRMFRKMSREQA